MHHPDHARGVDIAAEDDQRAAAVRFRGGRHADRVAQVARTVAVGLVGATQFVPILVLALLGGALADAFDRRRLMITAELGSLAVIVALSTGEALVAPVRS